MRAEVDKTVWVPKSNCKDCLGRGRIRLIVESDDHAAQLGVDWRGQSYVTERFCHCLRPREEVGKDETHFSQDVVEVEGFIREE